MHVRHAAEAPKNSLRPSSLLITYPPEITSHRSFRAFRPLYTFPFTFTVYVPSLNTFGVMGRFRFEQDRLRDNGVIVARLAAAPLYGNGDWAQAPDGQADSSRRIRLGCGDTSP
jgi:hypothetical protein